MTWTARRTARLAVVHAMADQGATLPAIAAAVGVTLSALREWLNRNDPDALDRITRRYTHIDDIRHLAAMGYNVDAIAHRLGIKPDSIKRRLQRRQEWALLDSIRTNHQPGRGIYRTRSAA